jgi:transporter family protein
VTNIPTWVLFALGSAFFAGLTTFFGKLGVHGINSNFATFIRTLVVLWAIGGLLTWRGEWQRLSQLSVSTWGFLVISGITTGLSWLCYFRALQLGPISGVASLDKLSLAFALLLGILCLGEPLRWQVMIGSALIIAGSLIFLIP